jgi:AhpD family alkylhydroperoxidase
MNAFEKRFYTPRRFWRDFVDLIRRLPAIRDTMRSNRVGQAFRERIMLVVTQVNGCRYCSYVHTKMALKAGLSEQELYNLMALDTSTFPEDEAVALTFAQHFAETEGHPDPAAEKRLRDYYSEQISQDIKNIISMIYFSNLCGNTVDAFLSRLKGQPAKESNPLSELILFLLFAPVTVPLLSKINVSVRQR